MYHTVTKKYIPALSAIIIFAALSFLPQNAHAQLGDVGDFLRGGVEDGQLLFEEYLEPFGDGFGAGLNSGWVDRANAHGFLGFHVKINTAVALVPDARQSFDVSELDFSTINTIDGGPVTPTFSGSSSTDVRLAYEIEGLRLADFRMPPGTGQQFIATPMVQAGVGVFGDTEIMARFIPPVKFLDYGEIYLYGLGVKHELNQWLPGGALLPVTFSLMAGYTAFGSSAGLDSRPDDFDPDNDQIQDDLGGPEHPAWEDQEVSFSTNAYTVNLLVGKSLPVISVYAGAGFEASNTSINVDGRFPFYVLTQEDGEPVRKLTSLDDPIDISIDGANSFRALAGVRISLPLVTFNVDYTLADYHMISAGLGISLR
ncbi:DUF6588 family protein [Natronogracilivirga saccharolytica]|uniref:Transporter n=1 Tax=Natronogracilivirga saccharolytica TaxID=2812953 RepID=A0A8J7UTD6_9BACT|nr:DUF6588 family protein [Natronogracilivirga saccharolytica]MBP3192501.1 hypothetical protein [Natronogracilivirga saccharolytica]